MKTDRELLELAAKADGRTGYIDQSFGHLSFCTPGETPVFWNPLVDDGDALRLMVKLSMDLTNSGRIACAVTCREVTVQEYHNGDPYAATRRAVVLAAAAIGERMP